ENINFYEHTARIAMYRERADEALRIAEQGLKKFDMKAAANSDVLPAAIDLASLKVDLLFFSKNIDGVRAVIKELRDLRNTRVAPIADFYAARIEAYNQNWAEAARQFAAVKIRLIQTPQLQAVASVTQGSCHLQLGQPDLAAEAYEWALERVPDMPIAKAGLAEARRQRGQMDTEGTPLQFDQAIAEELNKPPAEQNWESIQAQIDAFVVKQAEINHSSATWIKCRQALLHAQMYVMRANKETDSTEQSRLFELARNSIRAAWAEDRNDVTVQMAAIKMMAIEPKTGPAKALQRLDETVAANKKRGVEETPLFRLLRLELLMALRSEDLPNQLHAATTGMESWTAPQQAEVWAAVASRFDQLGRYPDAQLCYLEAIKLSPGALPYRIALFELARKQADDGGMRLAQERILEIVKDKTAPDYVLTEVKRMIVAHATGELTVDQLKPARAMLEEAIRRRPGWSELYILSGQLYTVLEKDMERAVTALNAALDKGQANMGALNLQIRLLADMGRFADARKIMSRIPEANWAPILDRTAANVLRNVGEVERAFQEAKRVADANPNDPATQVWFAEITVQSATAMASQSQNGDTSTVNSEARDRARNERLQIAETALKAAIANNKGNPDLWASLINHYMKAQRPTMVERTLRDAQLVLDEEFLALLTANQLRVFGRYSEAEPIFLSSYRADIDKLPVAQRMAEFYLSWAEHDAALRAREAGPLAAPAAGGTPAIRDKAVPHINRILRAANEDKALASDPVVSWARVQAARLFSVNNDYQDSLRAERMLASAVEANAATPEVQQMLVDILNRRGDPASRERAVSLLRKIQASRGLQANYELLLGQALFDVATWPEAERQMQEAISRHPQDLALRVGLIEMHIARKDETAAQRLLNRLESTPEGKAAAPQLRIRLAAAVGKKDEVRSMLVAMTPNLRVLKPEQLPIIRSLALLAESVGDTEYALQLMTEHARRVPGNELQLAHYTALYGDLDAALAMLRQLFPQHIDQVLSTAVEMHRRRRAEDPATLTPDVERFVRQARRDDPDAARRMVLEAEFLEIEQKFDEAIAAYRQILARDDVPRFVRATALNNLAFLLAMTKQDLEDALAGVDEAIQILGPISDVLDTRALVYIHSGQFDKAAADLRSAVKMNATASKYFHLTQALLGAGDEAGAVDAWKQAETRGLALEKVPNVEQDDFEATRQKIETLRSSTAQL
ncbi:MAG TPA: tetratricopeptide repeat protein, partial [Lacipirellulaceae bacterium]|nr:tetratricopeptide repeat protein [Lacipirellulaceae bacterium]